MGTILDIKPKEVENEHEGQRYRCRYDKIANEWVWTIAYVQTYTFIGKAPTLAQAVTRAKRKIHSLNNETEEWEGMDRG